MLKEFLQGFWGTVARIILRNPIALLSGLLLITIALAFQWRHLEVSNTEISVLPADHPEIVKYNQFVELFGEEDNAIVLGIQDSLLFEQDMFNEWNNLCRRIESFSDVVTAVSTANLQELKRFREEESDPYEFRLDPLLTGPISSQGEADSLRTYLFSRLPFYEDLIFNRETQSVRMVAYLDKDLLNTDVRNQFILNELEPTIASFEKETGMDVKISGMPYVRTWNSKLLTSEIGKFVLAALLITSFIFYLFFRSFRATFISMCVVIIGVMWSFGIIGLFRFEITILTALIPPLIIVIGIPNCIFLINKYQHEVKKHGNQALSLQRVIVKVGNATLMTNVTTASGFATFIILDSDLLKEFGIVASINILSIFMLSLLIIPIIYSFMPLPKDKHLEHLNRKWIGKFVAWMEGLVRDFRPAVYLTALVVLILGIIGIFQMKITGSRIEDLPKDTQFYEDIVFFEEEFNGIMPVEVVVMDTTRKRSMYKPSALKKINRLSDSIAKTPELSTPFSIVNVIKYSNQAFFGGLPNQYRLPSSQVNSSIMAAANRSKGDSTLLINLVDSTGQIARITTFMRDVKTDRMEEIERDLLTLISEVFPEERYRVYMTGKAMLFLKGTKYLVKNLVISLALAVVLISVFMAYLFRSARMILISLIPNLLPLLITAGLMGFLSIPIKPSTILVFSIAFGISVDDTIHFLAKYRQELATNNWHIRKSVYSALRETGISMFYTSVVLFFGFSVFTISSFGGTVALGALVSATLLFAMLSNLVLLPSLLLTFEEAVTNRKTFKEPHIDILAESDENETDSDS